MTTPTIPANPFRLLNLLGRAIPIPKEGRIGEISEGGRDEIRHLCRGLGLPFPRHGEVDWIYKTERGSWPKRYNRWLQAAHGLRPPANKIASVGALAERYKLKQENVELYFKVIKGCYAIGASGAGHPGDSCWWEEGEYDERMGRVRYDREDSAAYRFQEAGGLAILFGATPKFDRHTAIGRLWAYQLNLRLFVVFNGYFRENGDWGERLGEWVARALGGQTLEAGCDSEFHMNDDGCLIGTPEALTAYQQKMIDDDMNDEDGQVYVHVP